VSDLKDEDFDGIDTLPVGFVDAVYARSMRMFDAPGKGADGEP